MIQIHLKKSKYDQFGVGSDIVLGATGADVCPVKAIISYIEHRGSRMGAFFTDSSHKPLSKSWFIAQIRECLDAIGLPQHQYAGHSFQIGAATTAALVGIEDSI